MHSLYEYIRNTVRLILFKMIKFICIIASQPPASVCLIRKESGEVSKGCLARFM